MNQHLINELRNAADHLELSQGDPQILFNWTGGLFGFSFWYNFEWKLCQKNRCFSLRGRPISDKHREELERLRRMDQLGLLGGAEHARLEQPISYHKLTQFNIFLPGDISVWSTEAPEFIESGYIKIDSEESRGKRIAVYRDSTELFEEMS